MRMRHSGFIRQYGKTSQHEMVRNARPSRSATRSQVRSNHRTASGTVRTFSPGRAGERSIMEFRYEANQSQASDARRAEILAKDRKSTRLNSSHVAISYAVFCLKKKNTYIYQ